MLGECLGQREIQRHSGGRRFGRLASSLNVTTLMRTKWLHRELNGSWPWNALSEHNYELEELEAIVPDCTNTRMIL